MESEFTKQEILATYLNVIFFGQRAYGVAAAAETYFGKSPRPADGVGGRDPRRHHPGALALQPHRSTPSWPMPAAPTCCGACWSWATSTPRPHGGQRRADRRPRLRPPVRRGGPVRGGNGPPGAGAPAYGPDGRELPATRSTRPSTGACRPPPTARCDRPDRIRPPPRLSRGESSTRPCHRISSRLALDQLLSKHEPVGHPAAGRGRSRWHRPSARVYIRGIGHRPDRLGRHGLGPHRWSTGAWAAAEEGR